MGCAGQSACAPGNGGCGLAVPRAIVAILACGFLLAAGKAAASSAEEGTFSWTESSSGLPATVYFGNCQVCDIDKDGKMDIAAGSEGPRPVVDFFKGSGGGSWQKKARLILDNLTLGYGGGLELRDINCDGNLDIGVTDYTQAPSEIIYGATVRVYLGDGNYSWANHSTGLPPVNKVYIGNGMAFGTVANKTRYLAVGTGNDHWGNGKGLLLYRYENSTWVKENGTLPDTGCYYMASFIENGGELYLSAGGHNGVRVWKRAGGSAWENMSAGLPIDGDYFGVPLGNCSAGNTLELACGANAYRGAPATGVKYFRQNATGSWVEHSTGLDADDDYYGVTLADIDRDGVSEIAAAGNSLKAWKLAGSSWADISAGLPSGIRFYGVSLSDINGDGLLDIASTSDTGVRVWLCSLSGVAEAPFCIIALPPLAIAAMVISRHPWKPGK